MIPGERLTKLRGFSLVELLVTMAVLAVIASALVSIVGSLSNYWVSTQSRIQTFRNGRAALEFMARDLASLQQPVASRSDAVANPTYPPLPLANLQFLQDVGHSSTGLTPLLETGFEQVPASSNIFGQISMGNSPQGNLSILGYYLARSSNGKIYELRRVFVSAYANGQANPNYKIYSGTAQSTNGYPNTPAWLYQADIKTNSYIISENVVGFWVRCLDRAGNPIPWLKDNAAAGGSSAAPFKFNSAASFQMRPKDSSTNSTFVYLNKNTALPANQLPSALEITLITVDSNTPKRVQIPAMTDLPTGADDLPLKVAVYLKKLNDAKIQSAKMFSTVVKLGEAP